MIRYLLCLLLAAVVVPAAAHSHKKKWLEIVHPWTPETVKKEATTARVFMTIKNRGRVPDRLIAASTPRADKVELAAVEGTAGDGTSAAPFSIYTKGGGETQEAVIARSADIGLAAGTLGVMGAFSKGAPVRIIGAQATGATDF